MRRVRPIIEGLEHRQVMSADPLGGMAVGSGVDPMTSAKVDVPATTADQTPILYSTTAAPAATSAASYDPRIAETAVPAVAAQASNGVFAKNFQQFTYITPQRAKVVLSIQGRGSLAGTYVDDAGALNLRYDLSNSYTKILANVSGGTGRATLASVYSADQADSGATNSLSGVGSPLIGMINLRQFDLIPGGTVNVTAGIGVLSLKSAGPGSQIQLRNLPNTASIGTNSEATGNTPTYNRSLSQIIDVGSSSTTTNNITNNVISDVFLVQTLAGSDGEFVSAGNLVLTSNNGDPGPPPAPAGVVVTIDNVNGDLPVVPDLQTDPRIFGYDPTTGRVLRFQLNLNGGTGAVDAAFAPISVPGSPADVGIALGRDDGRQVLLVNTGTSVSVYDATFGTALGSFTVPAGFSSTASTDTITVIGSVAQQQLLQINVAASLAAGSAVLTTGSPAPYSPPTGLSLLGGITGLPGSNQVYTSVGATFNTLQPLENQLGYLNVAVTTTTTDPQGGLNLVNRFSTVQQQAFTQGGGYVPVPAGNPNDVATSVGSVDRNLAVNTGLANGAAAPNTIRLYSQVTQTVRGSVVLAYPNQLSDLSESFRPDLAGAVILDVQGNVQSVKGTTANGLVLNNAGNLNLVSFQNMTNSAIVGEPVGHLRLIRRTNVSAISTSRTVGDRNGVTFVPNLQQIGPLSHTRDRPQA
ncbi:hypothetical protein [Paludisphaera mucosa]|uniref:DUF4394 domain-containing protein n=1 Tax=Paludisphaera mucosa TaxID=3030827 RepID=A0ABT6FF94_9BACT|nr:hypothetical protein [Paludisphaera mucosa]MDG3006055.1 hypothetical protein [Paludisphaera mucosa]